MSAMDKVFVCLSELKRQSVPAALAIVVDTRGSTPQKPGAKAVFFADGRVEGTIGGGCLEAEARRRALDGITTGEQVLFELGLDEDFGWDDGLVCGGRARLYIDPLLERNTGIYSAIRAAANARRPVVFGTTIESGEESKKGTQFVTDERGELLAFGQPLEWTDALRRVAAQAASAENASLTPVGDTTGPLLLYVEPLRPQPILLIAGAGHVGQAVCRVGAMLGFEVVVLDDRAVFACMDRLPEASRIIVGDIPATVRDFPIGPDTYVVIVTRGHHHDAATLQACVHSQAGYIGMIGSHRKVRLIFDNFAADGIATQEELARVHTPIGLDIGAVTVEEIAVSIAAELVAVRRGKAVQDKDRASSVTSKQ